MLLPKVLDEFSKEKPKPGYINVIAGELDGSSYQWEMPIVEKKDRRRKEHYGVCENNLPSMIDAVQDFMNRRIFTNPYVYDGLTNETKLANWHIVIRTENSVISLETAEATQ
jgi:hypothetical protein